MLYKSYLSGDTLIGAAKKANINTTHSVAGKLLRNKHYIGDDYYPAIIDTELFEAVQAERLQRAQKLGRIQEPKSKKEVIYPTAFHMNEITQRYEDPFQKAEYAYNLIEIEVNPNGSE